MFHDPGPVLQGMSLARRDTHADNLEAIKLFNRAVTLDPKFAKGWAALSITTTIDWENFLYAPYQKVRPSVWAAASRAIQFGPHLADGHVAMATIAEYMDWDLERVAAELHIAGALDPRSIPVIAKAANIATARGRLDEAAALARQVIERDPLSGRAYWWLGQVELHAGRGAEAAEHIRKAIELAPSAAQWHATLAYALIEDGKTAEAVEAAEQEPDPLFRRTALPIVFDAVGRRADADRELAAIERQYAASAPDFIARIYGYRNDIDNVMPWLERAADARAGAALYASSDPAFKTMLHEPRFVGFLHRWKLGE